MIPPSPIVPSTVQPGNHIHVFWKGEWVQGIVLPSPEGETDFLHLKLTNGYNTGLAWKEITDMKILPTPAPVIKEKIPIPPVPIDKPILSLIAAGGTIGSKVDYKTQGVSALMTPEELVALIPEIGSFATFGTIISPFSKLSENINPSDWIKLAQMCHAELIKPEVRGVLVTHGTDTLHYTAAALSFMLRDLTKPVVLVGSQRSSDRGSSDAPSNLICASRVALGEAAEVGICMHATTSDDYCFFTRGTRVRKMHSSRRDAFRPINDVPLAKVFMDGKVEWIGNFQRRDNTKTPILDAVFDTNVVLIKFVPGISPDTMDYHLSRGVKGFLIEGTGLGHVSEEWIPAIQRATDAGVPVFVTTQTLYGRVNLNVYSNGRMMQKAGAVGLEDMLPEVAYVKLGWVLGHTHEMEKVREMMHTDYAGETSSFSRVDTFLL
ncbi:MAG: Glu-tRNA(Gln) amidotransferase subunit GatD [Candidatus Diapherotrites archaeon]|nr:Glu-tRNA(Gln) amidotransferase subunit GatD [Candidatus Diapherotrites archaeon]MDZ4256408.1 Glu-tRNA(Gln) amidotransferase subunit GatD [archaeon]